MQNVIMIILAALAVVLFFSPETLLSDPQNDLLQKIKDNSQLVALGCAAGAGYLYYTQQTVDIPVTSVEQSIALESDLPTYEQSTSSQQ